MASSAGGASSSLVKNEPYMRAVKIYLKSLDIQMEKQLAKTWRSTTGRSTNCTSGVSRSSLRIMFANNSIKECRGCRFVEAQVLDGAGTSIAALETIWNALGFNVSGPELFSALRGRLYDSNKNLVMATLSTIGGLVSAMGPSVEKSSKGILADVLKCLGDNKKHMRECTLTALDSLVAAAQLEKMDKSSKVRKAAESLMNEILRICGQEMVGRNLKDLPSPTLAIVSERLKLSTLKDLPSPTLAIVSERLKLSTAHEGFSESVKVVSTSMSLPSKAGLKNNKHGPNDRGSNVGKPVSQV
ncbi:Protein MOR1 [Zea mays]|uniref:Protein MOR1 n=1 Tax=Zea mays TaxID=4577 RepID=A0A1D6HUB8_MAIZE|nr:Protein MOR1 [Zea mays]